jgi:hypothetical protein
MMGGEGKASAQAGLGELMKAQDPQARAQALRGMIDLSDPGVASAVQSTLASDPNEDVRLAAFGTLLRAGEARDEAYRMALADPSPRVREIAECRQRLEQIPGL